MLFDSEGTRVGIAERKARERLDREQRITAAARQIAEKEGWSAVTIRRLAEEVEHSQPVLYSHFENRDGIVAAVAVEGFRELTSALLKAADGSRGIDATRNVAMAYMEFASAHPALYEAMFTMPTSLRFAAPDTKPELKASFAALKSVVGPVDDDDGVATETVWAALHGMAELERSGRIRNSSRDERVSLVVNGLAHAN